MTDVGRITLGNEAFRAEAVGRVAGRPERESRPGESSGIVRETDSVDVSDTARIAAAKLASEEPAVRQDLVDRVRAEIDAGTYESPIKVASTVDALLGSLA